MNRLPQPDNEALMADACPFELETSSNAAGPVDRFFQSVLCRKLSQLQNGCIRLSWKMARMHHSQLYGECNDGNNDNDETCSHPASIDICNPTAFRRLVLGGTIGAAESYIDGQWSSNDLTRLIRVMIRNMPMVDSVDRSWARLRNFWHWGNHLFRRNTIDGSRQNILQHYDLGNRFYQLFLDPTLSYSSAVFESLDDDCLNDPNVLQLASIRKMELVRRRLEITANDHVLEIGTGWGAMAIHLARETGCRITTTTISDQQFRYATDAVQQAGLSDRVTVLQQDYRTLDGKFDKLVSIEMIEAVGHQYYDTFFRQCSRLLKPDGLMLLQAIVIGGQHYDAHIRKVDFIRRYIFPGGCLPSLSAINQSLDRVTDLRISNLDDFTGHYVLTLRCWREAFLHRLSAVRALGFDDRFMRLWNFYLCYCEAAFAERRVNLVQMLLTKPERRSEPPAPLPAAITTT